MKIIYTLLLLTIPLFTFAQDDLMQLAIDSNETKVKSATFKGIRVINGHSVETVGKNNMDFVISHRFDRLNQGFDEFFGLDAATNRLALEYGLSNEVMIELEEVLLKKIMIFMGNTGC